MSGYSTPAQLSGEGVWTPDEDAALGADHGEDAAVPAEPAHVVYGLSLLRGAYARAHAA
jgi:hypothetical protein